MSSIHKTVLLQQSIDGLCLKPGDVYLDGTLGGGGHAEYALSKVGGDLTLIGLDRDAAALERSRAKLSKVATAETKLLLEKENYRNLDRALLHFNISHIDRMILDLGLSSDQFETSGRGFSFQKDEPLKMTFGEDEPLGADVIVNTWQESTLADVIYGYGEERYAKRIAKKIVEYRIKKKIETTGELNEIILQAVPSLYRKSKIHPATRTYQALRIAVNDELNALKEGLTKGFGKLNKGGRMAIISFHSLEDRIVKHFYKERAIDGQAIVITKKPIVVDEEELAKNPRSRSAKLRIIEKI